MNCGPCDPEVVRQAEALVHLLRDLSADVDEVMVVVQSAPLPVRMAAHALMQTTKEAN